MSRRIILAAAVAAISVFALSACGGGTSNGDKTKTAAAGGSSTPARTGTAVRTGTPAGSATAGTPAAGGTAAGSIPPGGDTPPAPGATVAPPPDGPTPDPMITGGDPNAPPVVVGTAPAVRPGGTVDPTQIAAPDPPSLDIALYIDLDASTPGIQSTRQVSVGDTFRVAVVVANAPPARGNTGTISAFNFILTYDKTKVYAPTYQNGPPTQRNPALNIDELGGAAAGWDCLPAPEGDLDDPGGIAGDGNPATGEAFLSCFTPGNLTVGGSRVVGVVTFQAVATGSTTMELNTVDVGDAVGMSFAQCADNPAPTSLVPCQGATLEVR